MRGKMPGPAGPKGLLGRLVGFLQDGTAGSHGDGTRLWRRRLHMATKRMPAAQAPGRRARLLHKSQRLTVGRSEGERGREKTRSPKEGRMLRPWFAAARERRICRPAWQFARAAARDSRQRRGDAESARNAFASITARAQF